MLLNPGQIPQKRTTNLNGEAYMIENEFVFFGKKIVIKESFKMYIILERMKFNEIDEFLLQKITLIDNSTEDKRSW
jgi:hypothetical protein